MLTTLTNEQWSAFAVYLFIDQKLDRGKDGHNESGYKSLYNILSGFFKDRPFSRDLLNEFVLDRQRLKKSNSNINNYIKLAKHLDAFFALKVPGYSLQLNNYDLFKEVRQSMLNYKYLTFEQMESIANLTFIFQPARNKWRTSSEAQNDRWRCLFLLLARTGCRINEALYLKFEDIGTDFVIFRDTKSSEDRFNFLDEKLCTDLMKLEKRSEYVFSGDTGKPMDDGYVNSKLTDRLKTLEIDDSFSCHDFRKSFVTLMNMSGCPISVTSKRVGHKDVKTTMRYDRSALDEQKKAMKQFYPAYRDELPRIERYDNLIRDLPLYTNGHDVVDINRKGSRLTIEIDEKNLA